MGKYKISIGAIKKANQKMIDKGIVDSHYKTIHENAVMINPPKESDAILFPKVETITSIIAEFKNKILQLEKYECTTNSGGQDCWATMELDKEGEYVKIEDILNLF